MRRNNRSVVFLVLAALVLGMAPLTNAIASPPTAVVIVMCGDYGTWPVVFYDHSSSAPAQTSGASCPAQLASLLSAGFTNVNITAQTYASQSGQVVGAPGGVNGTYTTYVLTNGTLSAGNL